METRYFHKPFICSVFGEHNLGRLNLRLEFQRIYCATNSGSPEVELRFCPWLIVFKY
jgi:hypothetical protein